MTDYLQPHPAIQNQAAAVETKTLSGALVNLAALHSVLDDALAANRPEWIPCRAGCSFCCWQMNEMVSWLEAAAIFNVVREWDASRKSALVTRALREVDALMADDAIMQFADGNEITPERLPDLAGAFRKHVRPCAFLDRASGNCTIYDVRPMHCRVFGQSVVMRRDEDDPALYGCTVVAGDTRAQIATTGEAELFDVTDFFKAQRLMEGAPHVFALPLAFWVKTVAEGPEWSLDYPETLFERFVENYKPLEFQAVRESEDVNGDTDAPAASAA